MIATAAPKVDYNVNVLDKDDVEMPFKSEEVTDEAFFRNANLTIAKAQRLRLQSLLDSSQTIKQVLDRTQADGDIEDRKFDAWCKSQQIKRSEALKLIKLAIYIDSLYQEGIEREDIFTSFTVESLIEAELAATEVRQTVAAMVKNGKKIDVKDVKALQWQWEVESSPILTDEVKEVVRQGVIPSKKVVDLLNQLNDLDENRRQTFLDRLAYSPSINMVKELTSEVRSLNKCYEHAVQLQTLIQEEESTIDLKSVTEEAERLDILAPLAKMFKAATQVEKLTTKLFSVWSKLSQSCDSIYVDTGTSTPNLRSLLRLLDTLSGDRITVPSNNPDNQFSMTMHYDVSSPTPA